MSDETTDGSSTWTLERTVGAFILIVFLSLLVVAICEATHTDDDNDTENQTYLDAPLFFLEEYGGTIYFGDSDSIYVPAKSTFQVKDGLLLVSYRTETTSYSSGVYHVYSKHHAYYGSIDQITYISINTHE